MMRRKVWAVACSLVSICSGFAACNPEQKTDDPDAGGGASGGLPDSLGGEGGALGGKGGELVQASSGETTAGSPGGMSGDGEADALDDPEDLRFDFERVSVSSDEVQGDGQSWDPRISADGRFIVFLSESTNFSEDASNATSAMFVRDLVTGSTHLMSVDDEGTPIDQRPGFPVISGDDQTLGFIAGSLGNAFQPYADLHLIDREELRARGLAEPNSTPRTAEIRDPNVSFDGTRLTFSTAIPDIADSDTNQQDDVFVYNNEDESYSLVSANAEGKPGNAESVTPRISADGRFVVFRSRASDLVEGDTNDKRDIFVRELATSKVELVSVSSDGTHSDDDSFLPAVSADGRFVVFESWARNLVAGDTNGLIDIYVRDRKLGTTTRVSISNSGDEPNYAAATPSISGDGRYIVFSSDASTLVEGDTNANADVFLYDQKYSKLVSVTPSKIPVTLESSESRYPYISLDGRHVTFTSISQFLVEEDDNGVFDVFVAHLGH